MNHEKKGGFKSARVLTAAAMLTALSVVIGIVCKNLFTFGIYFRVTFENLPIIICGILFGPGVGAICGICADVVSCLCSTNPAVNPLITVGAASVGIMSGLMPKLVKKPTARIALTVAVSHLVGQVIIKSIAKMIWFGMPWWGIFLCAGISALVGTVEFIVIKWLLTKKGLDSFLGGSAS